MSLDWITLLVIIELCFRTFGIIHAIQAVMATRSSRGTIAWVLSLLIFPYLAVPAYWIFGRNKFHGYRGVIRSIIKRYEHNIYEHNHILQKYEVKIPKTLQGFQQAHYQLTNMVFTHGNRCELLINGEATFTAILNALEQAQHYVLMQFFIIRDDRIGQSVKSALIACKRRDVAVYLLYDDIGSHSLTRRYIQDLKCHGVYVHAFKTTRGSGNRFQINFRNHRKIVLIDGQTAFIGGINVGDEYLGHSKRFGPWRDTFIQLQGPCVKQLAIIFNRDWGWSTGGHINVNCDITTYEQDTHIGIMATGPADKMPIAQLLMTNLINTAKQRLWIASPYFVPNEAILSALILASIRGVDVKIMLPAMTDHFFVYWCAYTFYNDLKDTNIEIYRYQPGFMHQKVILVDDQLAAVGTLNFDNRSLHLNFEMMALIASQPEVAQVSNMLRHDLTQCQRESLEAYAQMPLWRRIIARLSKLLEPVL